MSLDYSKRNKKSPKKTKAIQTCRSKSTQTIDLLNLTQLGYIPIDPLTVKETCLLGIKEELFVSPDLKPPNHLKHLYARSTVERRKSLTKGKLFGTTEDQEKNWLYDFSKVDEYVNSVPLRVSKSVAKLAKYLKMTSELETVRAIFYYITQNIVYNNDNEGISDCDSSAEVLKRKSATICGYANLFFDLATMCGLEVKKIHGYVKELVYIPKEEFQSKNVWNCVKIGDEWFLLDCFMAAGTIEFSKFKEKWVKSLNEHYFLCPPKLFIYTHFPIQPEFQFIDPPLTFEEFVELVDLRFLNNSKLIVPLNDETNRSHLELLWRNIARLSFYVLDNKSTTRKPKVRILKPTGDKKPYKHAVCIFPNTSQIDMIIHFPKKGRYNIEILFPKILVAKYCINVHQNVPYEVGLNQSIASGIVDDVVKNNGRKRVKKTITPLDPQLAQILYPLQDRLEVNKKVRFKVYANPTHISKVSILLNPISCRKKDGFTFGEHRVPLKQITDYIYNSEVVLEQHEDPIIRVQIFLTEKQEWRSIGEFLLVEKVEETPPDDSPVFIEGFETFDYSISLCRDWDILYSDAYTQSLEEYSNTYSLLKQSGIDYKILIVNPKNGKKVNVKTGEKFTVRFTTGDLQPKKVSAMIVHFDNTEKLECILNHSIMEIPVVLPFAGIFKIAVQYEYSPLFEFVMEATGEPIETITTSLINHVNNFEEYEWTGVEHSKDVECITSNKCGITHSELGSLVIKIKLNKIKPSGHKQYGLIPSLYHSIGLLDPCLYHAQLVDPISGLFHVTTLFPHNGLYVLNITIRPNYEQIQYFIRVERGLLSKTPHIGLPQINDVNEIKFYLEKPVSRFLESNKEHEFCVHLFQADKNSQLSILSGKYYSIEHLFEKIGDVYIVKCKFENAKEGDIVKLCLKKKNYVNLILAEFCIVNQVEENQHMEEDQHIINSQS